MSSTPTPTDLPDATAEDEAISPDATTGSHTDSDNETGTETDADSTIDSDGAPETDDTTSTPPRRRRLRRWAALGLVGAVLVALAGSTAYFFLDHHRNSQLRAERTAIVDATRTATTAILTYRARTVTTDVAAAQRLLTGSFADYYRTLARTQVIPAATDRKLSSQVRVSGVSIIEASESQARTLVFVTQTLSSPSDTAAGKEPTTTATAIRATLTRSDGRWLVSAFDPI